jgi:lipopolysaccharide/colanic/teichoic acid biosynthesis glycosyltransferase
MNWPVLIILAIGVKLSSPGPIIFKQRRIADLHGAANCPSSSTSCKAA